MSEFQCYQFRTIDRPLTDAERREVDTWSSRGQVSSTSAMFIYHYGDFRKDPEWAVEHYFDAMLYFANWGTRRLIFRLPAALADAESIEKYQYYEEYGEDYIRLEQRGEYFLLDIYYSNEGGGEWMEDNDFDLRDLTPLRDDLLNGDYRALYLAWVKFNQSVDEDELEEDEPAPQPPVPPNLKQMTPALTAFTGFFEIDDDLLEAVQSVSAESAAHQVDYAPLLRELSGQERLEWLSRLLQGEPRLDFLLRKRLEQLLPAAPPPDQPSLTPAELRALSAEKEKERQAREAAAAQAAYRKKMQELAKQEPSLWHSLYDELQHKKNAKTYDWATATLKDLRDLAVFQNTLPSFLEKMEGLKSEFGGRRTLLERWKRAGLLG